MHPHRDHAQLIEQTAKRYKAAQAGGIVAIILGFLLMAAGSWLAPWLLGGGLLAFLYGRLAAWWHHG